MPELVTTIELCERLKVSRSWVIKQRDKKKNPIPTVRLGKRDVRFPIQKVMSWLDAGYALE